MPAPTELLLELIRTIGPGEGFPDTSDLKTRNSDRFSFDAETCIGATSGPSRRVCLAEGVDPL
jgi:hypothetical protein